ncbi:MAG: type II secretion system protein GspG [Candidatus Omnitrophica bacterium]|nr:type II secretion system protein GspG [Candidatus Omnitrophota bacterium]
MKKSEYPQAFTILELVSVMVIILILAGMTVSVVRAAIESSRKRKSEIMIACLATAVSMYHTDNAAYPTDATHAEFATALESENYIEFKTKDLNASGAVVDPWEVEYEYLIMDGYAGTKWGNTNSYNLWSNGPDGSDDSFDEGKPDDDYGDDIHNW